MTTKWLLYILRCRDDSLYTGITTNIKRRLKEHNLGKGAKSLRGKIPAVLVYNEEYCSQNEARKREEEIKGWRRKYKLKLIANQKVDFKGNP